MTFRFLLAPQAHIIFTIWKECTEKLSIRTWVLGSSWAKGVEAGSMVWCIAHCSQEGAERPVLPCPVLGPQFKRETGKLQRVQWRATEGAGALEHRRCEGNGCSQWESNVGEEGPCCSLSLTEGKLSGFSGLQCERTRSNCHQLL